MATDTDLTKRIGKLEQRMQQAEKDLLTLADVLIGLRDYLYRAIYKPTLPPLGKKILAPHTVALLPKSKGGGLIGPRC